MDQQKVAVVLLRHHTPEQRAALDRGEAPGWHADQPRIELWLPTARRFIGLCNELEEADKLLEAKNFTGFVQAVGNAIDPLLADAGGSILDRCTSSDISELRITVPLALRLEPDEKKDCASPLPSAPGSAA